MLAYLHLKYSRGIATVKLDCSKRSNKDDLVMLVVMIFLIFLFAIAVFLGANNSFLSGFVSATIIWKWYDWIYKPVDRFIERNWPTKSKEG